ncbi:hypothetical protein [Vibrio ziniensis]|uniref:Uncharacterized protein n=1 Tax=Vibrio ziniensis TaxID=2711221 RepID=A0A6G7CN38_9VIBR|nr:hypothetical protein [Vibrio ziniensis]QIH43466.1 hypothetical protein G5S32_15830 [Vibrio ziniensis]
MTKSEGKVTKIEQIKTALIQIEGSNLDYCVKTLAINAIIDTQPASISNQILLEHQFNLES